MRKKLDNYFQVMLAEDGILSDLDKEGWMGDLKLDGTRCRIDRDENGLRIYGRRGLVYNHKLPHVVESFSKIRALYGLDGELVFIDNEGHVIFSGSQKRCQVENPKIIAKYVKLYPLILYLFDITHLNGINLMNEPYIKRRRILEHFVELQKTLHALQNIRVTPISLNRRGLYDSAIENGLEGIVLKKLNSPYVQKRSFFWKKVKARDHSIFVLPNNAKA